MRLSLQTVSPWIMAILARSAPRCSGFAPRRLSSAAGLLVILIFAGAGLGAPGNVQAESAMASASAPAKAAEPQLAHAFINWLQEPEHAAACAESLRFATANKAAEALLPRAFRDNPVIYPPAEVLKRSEAQAPVDPAIQHQMITVWSQLIN